MGDGVTERTEEEGVRRWMDIPAGQCKQCTRNGVVACCPGRLGIAWPRAAELWWNRLRVDIPVLEVVDIAGILAGIGKRYLRKENRVIAEGGEDDLAHAESVHA